VSGLTLLYGFLLRDIRKGNLSITQVWILVTGAAGILLLSYPAFSYDFFNYLFTAKTVLIYHKNPYVVIPLQFTGVDPWLSFMHWTHLPSAYTPLWILFTLPGYLLGFGYLLTEIWVLKAVLAFCYLATVKGIGLVLGTENNKKVLFGMAVFALNPLVIIETLVSPHNDIVMMMFAVWSLYFFRKGLTWKSWFLLSVSVAMKLMTIFLLPAFFMKWSKKSALLLMCFGFLAVLTQREVLSWYWLWILPFIALSDDVQWVILSGGVSFGLLLRYAPFLYEGNWDNAVPSVKAWVTAVPILLSLGIIGIRRMSRHQAVGRA
jgi:hypothetical protein